MLSMLRNSKVPTLAALIFSGTALAQGIPTGSSGGGGITPGTTGAVCATAGSILYSDGTLVQCAGAVKATSLALGSAGTLVGDTANVLGLRNGANAQSLYVYGTYTDASNYNRLAIIGWDGSSAVEFRGQGAGTGSAQYFNFFPNNSQSFRMASSGVTAYVAFRAQSTTIQADSGLLLGGPGDAILTRAATATVQHGAADAATATAQTITFQNVVAGTSNTAGANSTVIGSRSTGSGASGDLIFQTGGKGAAATTQNSAITALTIKGGTTTTLAGSVVLGSAAIATSDTDGFLYLVTMAGAPSGVPTAFTGRAAVIIDTTNNKICFYNGAWKCAAGI